MEVKAWMSVMVVAEASKVEAGRKVSLETSPYNDILLPSSSPVAGCSVLGGSFSSTPKPTT